MRKLKSYTPEAFMKTSFILAGISFVVLLFMGLWKIVIALVAVYGLLTIFE